MDEQTTIFDFINEEKTFTYASLFSGIGGFDYGLNAVGGKCVFASEIDKYAREAYKVLHNPSNLHGDISQINSEDVPDHDVMAAGFPCQSFSIAGDRGGFEDARGTLFFEVARIADAKKPKIVLLENVKGLVGHDKGKTLDTVLKTLSDLGYRVDFEVLNSKYFGVPQNRERIFIVAIRQDLVEDSPWRISGNNVVAKGKKRNAGYEYLKTFNFDFPEHRVVSARLKSILEDEVDEKYFLEKSKTEALVAKLNEEDVEDAPNVIHNIYGGFKESKPRIFKEESPTIRTSRGGGHLPSIILDAGDIVEKPHMKMVGHADIAGHDYNRRVYSEEGVSRALNTASDIGRSVKVAEKSTRQWRIRKLTPRECWRLQGFTDEQHDAVEALGISDSQRYKQAGNAVTVNVIKALGERLLPYV